MKWGTKDGIEEAQLARLIAGGPLRVTETRKVPLDVGTIQGLPKPPEP